CGACMSGVPGRVDPDWMFRLARATYAEMALAGITAVGEFHYLHHDADGRPYREPNAMADAVVAAAGRAELMTPGPGLRLGAAIHSVRAVPQEALASIATFARVQNRPLHV